MPPRTPAYLTLNRSGIFIFQFRFPRRLRDRLPSLPVLFRRSLGVRSRREALPLARRWMALMDELERQFFDSPEAYAAAIRLLGRYQNIESLSWSEVEPVLMDLALELDPDQVDLLEKAISFKKIQQQQLERLNEEVTFLKQTLASLSGQSGANPSAPPALKPPGDDVLLSELGERFIDYKRPFLKAGSFTSVASKIRLFLTILAEEHSPDLRVSELTASMVRGYRDLLMKLPAHRAGIPAECSIREMTKMGLEPISKKTVKDSTVLIKEFLTWIENDRYPIMPGLQSIFTAVKGPRRQDQTPRIPYTSDQLKKLFHSESYTKGRIERAADYWLPLLAVFTGARLAELAQLHLGDIRKAEAVWVLDLNEEDEKSLKSTSSVRQVPIHSTLVELGFLDFVKRMKQLKKGSRLFPEEVRTAEGKFDRYSKRFGTLRRGLGLSPEDNSRLDFHSFRHTVRTRLAEASVNEMLIDDIIGHSSSSASIGKRVYTHSQFIPQKQEAIEKLNYGFDFGRIRSWEHCRFARDLRKPQSASSRKN